MKKSLFSILALCGALALAACGDRAYAATLDGTVKATSGGNVISINYKDARWVDLGAGTITTSSGSVQYVTISGPDVTSMLNSASFQANLVNVSGQLYVGISPLGTAQCVGGQSVLAWAVGAAQYVSDNCAAANAINAASK